MLPLARRRWLLATLAVMALAQAALFIEHPMMDGLLDGENQTIASGAHFYLLHRVYLLTAAVQWLAAMLHAWAWLRADAQKFQTISNSPRALPRFNRTVLPNSPT